MLLQAKTLVVIVGPTAVGKTAFSIALAKHLDTEIISADARQFFKEMSVVTAVPSSEELKAIRHHFIHNKSIVDSYSVGQFEREALACITQLFKQKDILVMVGGSGLYINAIVKGIDSFPEVNEHVRKNLIERLANNGLEYLQDLLKQLDPDYYQTMPDLKNPRRVMRALEVCISSGKPYSSFLSKAKASRDFNVLKIGLEATRATLYGRINARVEAMVQNGLLKEVEELYPYRHYNALQTVGCNELFRYIDGELTFDSAVELIKQNTRHFAKRQCTWFSKDTDTHWVNFANPMPETLNVLDTMGAL